MPRHRPITITFLALSLGLFACSSDDDGGGGSSSAEADLTEAQQAELETMQKFADCIRENGLEDYPDPEVDENGYALSGHPFEDRAEDFMAAQEECQYVFEDRREPEGDAREGAGVDPAMWETVTPGGDCQCSDGSEYNLFAHQGDPSKVVLFLQDGGACFSAETCDPDEDLYNVSVFEGPDGSGILDFDDERNPFADYSVVYAPYCSGDVFMGNTTTDYGDITIQHKGYINGAAALDYLATTYPDATEVVVIGESAGSVSAAMYGGLVSDRYPDARITVLADGSGSYPGIPEVTSVVSTAWGVGNAIPNWPENAGVTAEQWSSFPGLFVRSGQHDPDIVFARHDYAYDAHQAIWYPKLGVETGDLLDRMDANEAQIEGAGVNLLSYTAPGDEHTALTESQFYTEEVNGVSLLDWVTKLIRGEQVSDVHCEDCAAG
jgi:hypothetical protein